MISFSFFFSMGLMRIGGVLVLVIAGAAAAAGVGEGGESRAHYA